MYGFLLFIFGNFIITNTVIGMNKKQPIDYKVAGLISNIKNLNNIDYILLVSDFLLGDTKNSIKKESEACQKIIEYSKTMPECANLNQIFELIDLIEAICKKPIKIDFSHITLNDKQRIFIEKFGDLIKNRETCFEKLNALKIVDSHDYFVD